MAAPTGLSSGTAPEPVTPEDEPVAPEATEQVPAGPQEPLAAGPGGAADGLEAEPDEPPAAELDAPLEAEPDELPGAEPDEAPGAGPDEALAAGPGEPAEALAAGAAATGGGEQGGQRRRGGRIMAAVAIIVVLAAVAAGAALAVVTHGFRPKTVVSYKPAAVFALRAGDCLNSSQNVLSVTVLPCTSPHDAEVFATFSLAGSSWPGSSAVQQQAAGGCQDRVAGYLNPALLNAGLTQEYVYPDQTAWKAGVRTAVCEVSSTTGPLTGSVRNTG